MKTQKLQKFQRLKIAFLALVFAAPALANAMGELRRPDSGEQTQCSRQQKAQSDDSRDSSSQRSGSDGSSSSGSGA